MPIEFTSMVFPPKAMDLLLNSGVLPRGSCLFQGGQKRRGQYKMMSIKIVDPPTNG